MSSSNYYFSSSSSSSGYCCRACPETSKNVFIIPNVTALTVSPGSGVNQIQNPLQLLIYTVESIYQTELRSRGFSSATIDLYAYACQHIYDEDNQIHRDRSTFTFVYKMTGTAILGEDYLLPKDCYCFQHQNQTFWKFHDLLQNDLTILPNHQRQKERTIVFDIYLAEKSFYSEELYNPKKGVVSDPTHYNTFHRRYHSFGGVIEPSYAVSRCRIIDSLASIPYQQWSESPDLYFSPSMRTEMISIFSQTSRTITIPPYVNRNPEITSKFPLTHQIAKITSQD